MLARNAGCTLAQCLTIFVCGATCGSRAAAEADSPRVVVEPLLLSHPSEVDTAVNLDSLGARITNPDQLIPGGKIYLEIWFQTWGPFGIAAAVLDIAYETGFLDTSLEQIAIADPWDDVFASTRFVDDGSGIIEDVGGITFIGQGLQPRWAKLATIEFDVVDAGVAAGGLCTLDGGPTKGFGMVAIGAVPNEEVHYRCICIGEHNLDALVPFVPCLSGPDATATPGCGCADINHDDRVDLADFAGFQAAFQSR